MITAATEGIGSRSSRVIDGLASASTSIAMAIVRTTAPRLRAISNRIDSSTATPNAVQTTYSGTRGAKATPRFMFNTPVCGRGPRVSIPKSGGRA